MDPNALTQPIQNETSVMQSNPPQQPVNKISSGNKWKLILSIMIFAIITLGVATYYLTTIQNTQISQEKVAEENQPVTQNESNNQNQISTQTQQKASCDTIQYSSDKKNIDCFINLAVSTKDASICENIKKEVNILYAKDPSSAQTSSLKFGLGDVHAEVCYEKVGAATNDLSMCNKIGIQSFLKWSCYNDVAASSEDPNICRQLDDKDSVDRCLSGVGIKKKSLLICDEIKKESYREACYSGVFQKLKDINICFKINSITFQDGCYSYLAKENKDYKLCQKISSESSDSDSCFEDVARLTGDISICKYVKKYPVFCYAAIAIYKNDSKICNQYSDDIDLCISDFAIAKNRIDLCPSIQESFHRNDCYSDITSKLEDKGDPNACGKITADNSSKDACYTNLAIDKKAPELCDYVLETGEKNFCLNRTGALTANLDICNKIVVNENKSDPLHKDQQMKDQCYNGVGIAKKDKSICQQIKGDYEKTSCLTDVDRGITSHLQPTPQSVLDILSNH
jgi:hypothetical protein